MKASISVVIPCYNRESLILRAIDSALAQTVHPLEVLVIDDGSQDRSADMAEGKGSAVRVIRQENRGAAAARNRGIQAARGDWIAFLDSDDVWAANKLQEQLEALTIYPDVDLVFCNTQFVDNTGRRLSSRFELGGLYGAEIERQGRFARYDRSLFLPMLAQSRIITSAVMVRRGIPLLSFPEHIWGAEDWALWLTLALTARLASVDDILVTMFQQGDNLTSNRNVGKLHRNDVRVLEELLVTDRLTSTERGAVERALSDCRTGAIYHSLIRGETTAARALLRDAIPQDLGRLRYLCYWMATYLPSGLVERVGRRRLAELYESY